MSYGMPYKGSKNRIAEWVVATLSAADVFVDLFAGGCAVTHAAMESGKWKTFICNDISGTPLIFKEAIDGAFDGFSMVPTRAEMLASNDVLLKMLYSFGNDQATYLWGKKWEDLKREASQMLSAPSMHERRFHYVRFIKLFQNMGGVQHLQSLESIERLQKLKDMRGLEAAQNLWVLAADYRNVFIPDGATVYADPPYRSTSEHYGGFDFDAFDAWLAKVPFPVYVSEYDAPHGCVCIAEKERMCRMAANNNSVIVTERIFVQKRFA